MGTSRLWVIRVTGSFDQKGLVDVVRDPTTLDKDLRQINDSLSYQDAMVNSILIVSAPIFLSCIMLQ